MPPSAHAPTCSAVYSALRLGGFALRLGLEIFQVLDEGHRAQLREVAGVEPAPELARDIGVHAGLARLLADERELSGRHHVRQGARRVVDLRRPARTVAEVTE